MSGRLLGWRRPDGRVAFLIVDDRPRSAFVDDLIQTRSFRFLAFLIVNPDHGVDEGYKGEENDKDDDLIPSLEMVQTVGGCLVVVDQHLRTSHVIIGRTNETWKILPIRQEEARGGPDLR